MSRGSGVLAWSKAGAGEQERWRVQACLRLAGFGGAFSALGCKA